MSENTHHEALEAFYSKLREIRRHYDMISTRDRMLLNGMVLFLVLILGYFLLLKPSFDAVEESRQALKNKQELLQWVKSNEQLARSLTKSTAAGQGRRPGQSLLALVNQTSGKFKVPLKRYEPEGTDKLRVWVEDVSFNKYIRWLNNLQKRNNVTVLNISIDSQKEPGIINAKVVLKG